jgi:cytosine deaminase
MGGESDMTAALDMVTVAPARILGRQDHGLAVGCRADLLVLDASMVAEAVGGFPARALVVNEPWPESGHGREQLRAQRRGRRHPAHMRTGRQEVLAIVSAP